MNIQEYNLYLDSKDIKHEDIQVNDTLILQSLDEPTKRIKEKVTSINNSKTNDPSFQIRTVNCDYDFENFYMIVELIKAT